MGRGALGSPESGVFDVAAMRGEVQDRARLGELSDAELVSATRRGDSDAYGQLWIRHAAAGTRAARAITGIADPDDLVSEAFAAILSAIQSGGGPREAFRPYLFAAIRNQAVTWARKSRDVPMEDLDLAAHPTAPDPGAVAADRAVLVEVFRSLPERWRTLLWYLEVEGLKPREVALVMGMTPNATSALAYRARAGLRQAWIDVHISDPRRPEECRWVCAKVTDQRRRSRTDARRLDAHLETCAGCRLVVEDVDRLSGALRSVLLALVLGGSAATAYLLDAPAPAAAAEPASSTVAVTHAGEMGGRVILTVAAGAVAVTVAVGVAAAALQPRAEGATMEYVSVPAIITSPPAGPTGTPTPQASPTPTRVISPPAPPARVIPATPAPPAPTPTPTPTTPPIVASDPPVLDAPANLAMRVLAAVHGKGMPGAEIVLSDDLGTELARALAAPDGAFTAAIPGGLIRQGMTITAVQTAQGRAVSPASAPIGPVTFVTPGVVASGPVPGLLVDADEDGLVDDVWLELSGEPGASLVVDIDGVPTGRTHVLEAGPLLRYARDLLPGTHTFTVRYLDPETGAVGLPAGITIDVIAPAAEPSADPPVDPPVEPPAEPPADSPVDPPLEP